MSQVTFNYNQRPDPLLNPKIESDHTLTRLAQEAIPFLSFYKPAALAMSMASAGIQGTVHLIDLKKAYQERNWKACGKEGAHVVFIVVSVSLMIFRPGYALALSHSYVMLNDGKDLALHLIKGEYRKASKKNL